MVLDSRMQVALRGRKGRWAGGQVPLDSEALSMGQAEGGLGEPESWVDLFTSKDLWVFQTSQRDHYCLLEVLLSTFGRLRRRDLGSGSSSRAPRFSSLVTRL